MRDLFDQTILVLLLELGVFTDLLGNLQKFLLEFFTRCLAVSHHLLVLGNVFLQVVEDLELFVEGDQRVQLVLKLNLFLFQGELDLVMSTLVEHGLGESLGGDCGSHRLGDGSFAGA